MEIRVPEIAFSDVNLSATLLFGPVGVLLYLASRSLLQAHSPNVRR